MNDFNLSHCYSPSTSAANNRKLSRSDLVFQKLKKYEEKYKTNRNLISVRLNRELVEADSESDIEQYEPIIPKYTGRRDTQQELTTNSETSKHTLQKGETITTVQSLKNANIISSYECPRVVANNKSLVIDLKVDNVHFVNSDDSKSGLITNSFPSACQDRNCISPKKSFDASKAAAGRSLIHETTTSSLKTSVNNNLVESDTCNDLNNLHRHRPMLKDYHTDQDSDHMYSNSISTDNNNRNESNKVDLYLTDEMKEIQQPCQPAENTLKQNKNELLKQINSDPLRNREKPHEELESIRTEIFQSNSDVTSYEVPDISNSFDMDVREKSESSHLDRVVTSESPVTSGDAMPQSTDDKTVTVSASNTVNGVISSCTKSNKSLRKEYKPLTDETLHYCKTKSTQTNINVFCQINDTQLPHTIAEEDVVLSPYSLFVYHYLLHGNPQDHIKKDTDCAVSFLNKCLMEQVNITQHLINSHQATYNAYCKAARNLSKNYQPITLENTMQYINESKKKKRNKMVSP